jgi:hypothetical protein
MVHSALALLIKLERKVALLLNLASRMGLVRSVYFIHNCPELNLSSHVRLQFSSNRRKNNKKHNRR